MTDDVIKCSKLQVDQRALHAKCRTQNVAHRCLPDWYLSAFVSLAFESLSVCKVFPSSELSARFTKESCNPNPPVTERTRRGTVRELKEIKQDQNIMSLRKILAPGDISG